MDALKNLTESPALLADLIEVRPGRVVSMALSRNPACQMTLFAFDAEESISEEAYCSDTLYYVVAGSMTLIREGQTSLMPTGSVVAIPANVPHAIGCGGPLKLLQINLNA